MSASTSRSNSTASSVPSTPSLSPRVHSTEWTHSSRHSTMFSSTSTSHRDPVAHSSQEWWEHVLPPGQLAERLRKAQRSSSASRRRNNPALANATPSERSAWKRLSGLPSDKADVSASSSKRTSLDEPSSSHLRSSTDVSSDENASPTGRRSPARYATSGTSHFGPSSRQHSPEQASVSWHSSSPFQSPPLSRSTSSRRCRILSEDDAFASTRTLSQTPLQRSFSGTNMKRLSHLEAHSLPDTPEISSDENSDSRSSNTVSARRREKLAPALSRHITPPTILRSSFDHPDQPLLNISNEQDTSESAHVEKHVSFDETGNASTRDSSHITFNFAAFSGHENGGIPATSLPRSNSTRRARQGVRINGRKATSFSLPGSRRSSLHDDLHYVTPRPDSFPCSESKFAHGRSASLSDAALLDSLNVAHRQLASAGNLALTLTRQLSAPLRPFFHLTLFFSISSITVASLACFLFVSYMLTAWDDVSQRSQKVSRVAVQTKTKVESGLGWGIRMLASTDTPTASAESKAHTRPRANASGDSKSKAKGVESSTASDMVFWPLRMALTGAGSVASRVTPSPIAGIFTNPKEGESSRASHPSTRPAQRQSGSTLPPRPPLSLLLPSIMFTLVIAIGAGLTSFFASRRAAAEAARFSPAQSRSSSPGATPAYSKSGSTFVHMPASFSASTSPLSSPVIGSSYFPRTMGSREQYVRPQSAF